MSPAALPLGAQVVADVERGLGWLLIATGTPLSLSFLYRWDGHVGAIVLFSGLCAVLLGVVTLVAGLAVQRRWRLRWALQLLPVILVWSIVRLMR